MVIENYMPDFAVEAVYDLTVPSLQAQGIKAVLVDLDNIRRYAPSPPTEGKTTVRFRPRPTPVARCAHGR